MSNTAIVVLILLLIVVVAAGVVLARRRRSTQLQEHFGPEYERSVSAASGDRRAAEAALAERQQRRQQFDVRDLRPEERTRFRDSWNEVQRGFVDDPRQALRSADLLVVEVMRTRGYPVDDDFDRRADDLSVDHPRVVQHFREARRVRDADDTDTENQRKAVTSYRSLVNALLGDDDGPEPDRHRDDVRDHEPDDVRDDEVRDDRPRDADHAAGTTVGERDAAHRDTVGRDHLPSDTASGRHALRDGDARGDGPADPNGPQGPRTEERTR